MTRLYSVVRYHRDSDGIWEKVEASGLPLGDARETCEQLEKLERAAHPHKTSWTRDLFIPELDKAS